jgi:hypothetical protein
VTLAALTTLLFSLPTLRAHGAEPPRSGVIILERYQTQNGREVEGSRIQEKIVFRVSDTRWESRRADRPASVIVQSSLSWSASADWDRARESRLAARRSYPDEVRAVFARLFAGREPQQTTCNGWKCWKYAWHEEARILGDIGSSAQDVRYWVLADAQFPLVLKYESSLGARMETRELRLNAEVPSSLFEKPSELRPLVPFRLPEGEFHVEVKRERISHRYGWKNLSNETYTGSSASSTYSYSSRHTLDTGVTNTFTVPIETLDEDKTKVALGRLFHFDFGAGREVRKEKALGLTASVLVARLGPDETLTSWIVDHPKFGTICVKSVRESRDETETMEVFIISSGMQVR